MKKSFFGFSAKIAMAVLAVCSFALTSCYEKAEPNAQADPVFWVVGTVYDATTSETLAASVNVGSTAVTGPNFAVKVVGSQSVVTVVNVSATMEGYHDVARTVSIAPAGYNQVSVTSADLAMVPVVEPEEPAELVAEMVDVTKNFTADQLKSLYGFPENTSVKDGVIYVCDYFPVDLSDSHDSHGGSDSHDSHGAVAGTSEPYDVEYPVYSGYISADAESMLEIANNTLQTVYVGKDYAAFAKDATTKEETLNADGAGYLIGWWLDKKFAVYELTYGVQGLTFKCTCVRAEGSVVSAEFDTHDSHDSHDSHDNHNNHGGTNAGGGAGDAE